ncbi:MAG: hypothetical protein WBA97_38560 [Actinophytocola sp.]
MADPGAEGGTDHLVTEADAEDRDPAERWLRRIHAAAAGGDPEALPPTGR